MKKSFLLYLIMSVFLIGYCACDNDEENFDTATTGQVINCLLYTSDAADE